MIRAKLLLVTFGLLSVACGREPSPVIVGHVDDGTLARALVAAGRPIDDAPDRTIELRVNGVLRAARVDADNVFVLRDLDTGDLELEVEADAVDGAVTLQDVRPGETIDLRLRLEEDQISLDVERRDRPRPEELPAVEGSIVITSHDVVAPRARACG